MINYYNANSKPVNMKDIVEDELCESWYAQCTYLKLNKSVYALHIYGIEKINYNTIY